MLVHVVEAEPTYAAYGFSPDEFPAMHEIQQESLLRSERKLEEIASETGLKGVQTKVLQGHPLHRILEYAKEVDSDMFSLHRLPSPPWRNSLLS